MKKPLLFLHIVLLLTISVNSFSQVDAGRMNEVFIKTDLQTGLSDPWEITYGPDDSLWVTEAKGYRVSKMHPDGGTIRTVLDLTNFSDPLSSPTTKWRKAYTPGTGGAVDPQGGLMGLAVHPEYNTNPAKKFVYIAYVHDYVGNDVTLSGGEFVAGYLFRTWVVRFTFNTASGKLENPIFLCDTIRGSDDHNSGRLIIAPVGGKDYLFYAVGDQGGGQFGNIDKVNKAQVVRSYEGKILRFNLEPDGDAGAYDKWIPSTGTGDECNPFNTPNQSAVWSTGMRNNQGFAYAKINGVDRLYGSSHGPFSDDEVNLIERAKNYGHPIVVGYNDGNYNGARAGQIRYPYTGSGQVASNLPLIVNENTNVNTINAALTDSYRDPLYSFYDTIRGSTSIVNSIQYIYNNTSGAYSANASWASEGLSGLGIYPYSQIPGWKNSLLFACLKRGRILRTKLDPEGTAMVSIDGRDTVSYFNSRNKFRDVAVSANGKDIYTVIDQSPTTSGPGSSNPIVSACGGCIQRYRFVGYLNNGGASTIPSSIPVARGQSGVCTPANTITIDATNRTYWVPITDDSSNIVAEIKANTNNLGEVTTSFFYKNSGAIREDGSPGKKMYLDRNITITPANQPTSNVNIRLYITAKELARMIGANNSLGNSSNISDIDDISIFKTEDNACNTSISSGAIKLVTTRAAFGDGYVLSATTSTFSTFFFASNALTTLPVNLLSFTGDLMLNKSVSLEWKTTSEINTARYEVERSLDGQNYVTIGTTTATGGDITTTYSYTDNNASAQPSLLLYYRLKMVDADEGYKYSNIVTISLADIAGKIVVTPNPAKDFTKISIVASSNGKAQWKIVDNTGHIVSQNEIQLKSGTNISTINTSQLAAGIYYIHISGPAINERVKLQKL